MKFFYIFLTLVCLTGCAGHQKSFNTVELDQRIKMHRQDREDQLKLFGYLGGSKLKKSVKLAFQEGWVISGMGESMVFDMYGPPDSLVVYAKNIKDWIYINSRGYEMSRIKFIDNIVVKVRGHMMFRRTAP